MAGAMPAFSRFLRYFVVVARSGSLRRASEQLGVSPSAIDRQILNAEAQLGMPLFERLPGGLRLTAAGEVLMAAAGRWQKGLVEVCSQIEDLRGLNRGQVTLALTPAAPAALIAAAIATVQREHPGIAVSISHGDAAEARQRLIDGTVDLALLPDPHAYRDLAVRAWVACPVGVIMAPDHPLAGEAALRLSALEPWPLIMPEPPLAAAPAVLALATAQGIRLDRRCSADSAAMIVALVRQGAGIGLATRLEVADALANGQVQFVPLADPALRPPTLALCTSAARQVPHAATIVLAALEADLARWPGAAVPA